jgi:hypothetical protein
VDYQEELNFKIGNSEKEFTTITMMVLHLNIIFINGNQQMIVVIIHVEVTMFLKILLAS